MAGPVGDSAGFFAEQNCLLKQRVSTHTALCDLVNSPSSVQRLRDLRVLLTGWAVVLGVGTAGSWLSCWGSSYGPSVDL